MSYEEIRSVTVSPRVRGKKLAFEKKKLMAAAALLFLAGSLAGIQHGHTVELTMDNWNHFVGDKAVFLKFFANSAVDQRVKPTWDELAVQFDGNDDVLIGDVDCVGKGDTLCKKFKIKSTPTFKYMRSGEAMGTAREYMWKNEDVQGLARFANRLAPQKPFFERTHTWKLVAMGIATAILMFTGAQALHII